MLPYRSKLGKYFLIGFIVLIVFYGIYELKTMHSGPQINISSPDGGVTVSSQEVDISGTVSNVKTVLINGRPVVLDEDASFTERLLLYPGYNRFEFDAIDKFDRKKTKVLELIYKPKQNSVSTSTPIQD